MASIDQHRKFLAGSGANLANFEPIPAENATHWVEFGSSSVDIARKLTESVPNLAEFGRDRQTPGHILSSSVGCAPNLAEQTQETRQNARGDLPAKVGPRLAGSVRICRPTGPEVGCDTPRADAPRMCASLVQGLVPDANGEDARQEEREAARQWLWTLSPFALTERR